MYHHEEYQYCNHPQSNSNSGLLRFRSAPTSLFSNFANGVDGSGEKGLMNDRCSSPEAQKLTHFASQSLLEDSELESKPLANGLTRLSSQLPPQYPRQSSSTQLGSMGTSNLMRQSSSPAGLFSNITAPKGYGAQRGYGNYRVGNGTNGDLSPSSNRLKGQINFSSGMSSSLGMFSHISELDSESNHGPGYAFGLWNDSLHCPDNFSVLKRDLENDGKLFGGIQNVELDNHSHILSHHLSLPKTSAEIAAMEKFLHFQDAVPCKVRAKRGCATHPRSIAERVRRTRISERMRKLQELVPNMDKQTNTADMLDLAVDYIKDLQKQHKTLSENRANCKCSSSMQKPLSNIFS